MKEDIRLLEHLAQMQKEMDVANKARREAESEYYQAKARYEQAWREYDGWVLRHAGVRTANE